MVCLEGVIFHRSFQKPSLLKSYDFFILKRLKRGARAGACVLFLSALGSTSSTRGPTERKDNEQDHAWLLAITVRISLLPVTVRRFASSLLQLAGQLQVDMYKMPFHPASIPCCLKSGGTGPNLMLVWMKIPALSVVEISVTRLHSTSPPRLERERKRAAYLYLISFLALASPSQHHLSDSVPVGV